MIQDVCLKYACQCTVKTATKPQQPIEKKRERSIATISALTAMYRLEQLPGHIGRGLANGLSKDEIIEIITHMAFYCGWPNAMSALSIARKVFAEHKG